MTIDVLSVGLLCADVTMSITDWPLIDEKVAAQSFNIAGGGPAANASVAVSRLGGKSAFAGYVGNDPFGNYLLHELEKEGVLTDQCGRGNAPTSLAIALVTGDGSRRLVSAKAPGAQLNRVSDFMKSLAPKVILFDGHEDEVSQELWDRSRKGGTITVLDAGSRRKGTEQMYKKVSFLVCSQRFAKEISGRETISEALEHLRSECACVVITLGADGLVWANGAGFGALPALSVKAVDTTGAGDAFHGAFALGLSRQMEWASLLSFASAAGAFACTQLGARAGMPTLRDVENLMSPR